MQEWQATRENPQMQERPRGYGSRAQSPPPTPLWDPVAYWFELKSVDVGCDQLALEQTALGSGETVLG